VSEVCNYSFIEEAPEWRRLGVAADQVRLECERVRVLLVEDEARVAQVLSKGLRETSYAVDVARSGEDALYQAAITDYDAIILDVMLPGIDGFEVCRELRRLGSHVPVLMLTARDAIESRIAGLDSGADDYLVKPFDFRELLARLRAVIRRGQKPQSPTVLTVDDLRIDLRSRQATRRDRIIKLTSREFALLEFLAIHAGEVVGRSAIAEHVWDASFESMSNVIDVLIQRLRRKIDDPARESLITTRRGEGYMLSPASAVSHNS
jgi:DNA-binding response OmpR family regulator